MLLSGLVFSALFSAIAGLIYGVLTVSLRCNQNVTGLVLTTFGGGIADYFMSSVDKTYFSQASKILSSYPLWADNLGAFGKIFFAHGFLVYFAIVIAILTAVILKKTRIGLNLRSVGENPAAADADGVNVNAYKYSAILTGSIIAGFSGLFYVMDYVGGSWENSSTIQAFGWLAIALVIFVVWKPSLAILGSILFGFLYILLTSFHQILYHLHDVRYGYILLFYVPVLPYELLILQLQFQFHLGDSELSYVQELQF